MKAGRLLLAGALVSALSVTGFARLQLDRLGSVLSAADELLYLPNGKHLRMMSLGHRTLVADAVYLWAIQYYSNYEREDRYRYIEHVFHDVITELDPHYVDAYWLGALILIIEAEDLPAGLRLLEKGASLNPDEWVLPYLAGWESYHARRFDDALRYFRQAAEVPDSPSVVRRLHAGMFSKMGDYGEAVAHWTAILDDPRSDATSVSIARRQLDDLRVLRDITMLRGAIERFRAGNGRVPSGVGELAARSYIDRVPLDPAGRAYVYDPAKGTVRPETGRILGDR